MSMSMIEQLQNADTITQGWFVAGSGLVGVFLVLLLFFFSIKLLQKMEK
jgi:hypothetical protein